MQPIRGQRTSTFVHDPWGIGQHLLGQQEITHVVTDDGAIQSEESNRQVACGCGCLKPPGGYCGECQATACTSCFGLCSMCSKPLCPRHSFFVPAPGNSSPGGSGQRYCKLCHDTAKRQRVLGSAVRLLLSPFIRFGTTDETPKQ